MAQDKSSPSVQMLKKVMKALLVSGIYFGWAILFYCLREGWRPIDAIYFAMVTSYRG